MSCFITQPKIIADLIRLEVEIYIGKADGVIAKMRVESTLLTRIKEAQKDDEELWAIMQNLEDGKHDEFWLDEHGVLWCGDRLCVPDDTNIQEELLSEAHSSPVSIHHGSTKMYWDLKQNFWWNGRKKDVAEFVSKCLICQHVKIEHQQAIVDRLTKSTHFLAIHERYFAGKLAKKFQKEIVRLHGTPVSIVSDRDPHFTSQFLKGFQKAWGTKLNYRTAFHPQTDGQSERTIQTSKDMLRSPICWNEVGEEIIEGPELVRITNEEVEVTKEKLKEAHSRQKSYVDKHHRTLYFKPGDHVFLKVSPWKGVQRFGIKGKLSPRFIGPFKVLEKVGEVAYRIALPPALSHVHNVFHVSTLRGYNYHPLYVVEYPLDKIREDLSCEEEAEAILAREERIMRRKAIPFVKVLWKNHFEREATWELEESIHERYP
ncbi:putative nucleotidyltransferase, ribonuclease H [Tanacetum coccineum]